LFANVTKVFGITKDILIKKTKPELDCNNYFEKSVIFEVSKNNVRYERK